MVNFLTSGQTYFSWSALSRMVEFSQKTVFFRQTGPKIRSFVKEFLEMLKMKKILGMGLMLLAVQVFGQQQTANCKVLSIKLQGSYQGECKNRLAHGEGTAQGTDTYQGTFKEGVPQGKGKYVYSDGSYYIGEFKNGLRHGEGTLYTMDKEAQTITAGKLSLWKNDEFLEEILEKKYKLLQSINTLSIQFDKPDERQDRVEIFLGTRSVISGINVTSSTGNSYIQGTNRVIIENVSFPLMVRLNYSSQKGIRENIPVRVEFELQSKGHWKINLNSQ